MSEQRIKPLPSRHAFAVHLAQSLGWGLTVITISLLVGVLGYHHFENLGWLDAFLNASMLLGGMGPVEQPRTDAGKLFAGCYALYCGLVVIVVVGIMMAPVARRFLHKLHLDIRGS